MPPRSWARACPARANVRALADGRPRRVGRGLLHGAVPSHMGHVEKGTGAKEREFDRKEAQERGSYKAKV